MAVAWVVLIPLALCGGLLLVALLGRMFFNVLGGTANQQAVQGTPQNAPGVNSLLGSLVGVAILLAVFVLPILFWVGAARKVTHTQVHVAPSSQFDRGFTSEVSLPEPTLVSSDHDEQAKLISSLESAITRLEETDIPLPTVRAIRGLRQTLPTLYQPSGNAASTEDDVVQLAEAPATVPNWAREGSRGGIHIIMSEPSVTEEAAIEDAWAKATSLLTEKYRETNGRFYGRVDVRELGAVRKKYTEQIPWNFKGATGFTPTSEATDFAFRTYLQVDTSPSVLSGMYDQWRRVTAEDRVQVVTVASGLMIAAVTLLAVFFRIEKRGFLRRGARFASLLGAAGLVVGSCGVAAEGLENLEPPAAPADAHDVVDEEHYVMHRPASGGASEFSGIQINSRRIGFIVVGGDRLGGESSSDLIAGEISKCLNSFKEVDYKVFCESSRQRIQFGGTAGASDPTNESAIKRLIQVSFPKGSEVVFPGKTINNVLKNYGPDQVVVICNSSDEFGTEASKLVKALGKRVPAEIFQFDDDQLEPWTVSGEGGHRD